MTMDPYWNKVVLAMHLDGADGATVFTDEKGHAVTRFGTPAISTVTYAPLTGNTASLRFPGTAGRLTVANTDDVFNLGAGDFTIEFFTYFSNSDQCTIMDKMDGSTWTSSFYIERGANGKISAGGYCGGSGVSLSSIAAVPNNTWVHVAFSRYFGMFRLFIDGVLQAAGAPPSPYGVAALNNFAANPITIGSSYSTSYQMTGYLDDIRITKACRYTADFAKPTAPFGEMQPVVQGTVLDVNGNGVARNIRAYDRITGLPAGVATSNAATGTYTLNCETVNEVQVILLDDAAGAVENDQILRTTPV